MAMNRSGFLTEGSTVEVTSEEKEFKGAWYSAYIVQQHPESEDEIFVLYRDRRGCNMQKYFHSRSIRPLPPPPPADQSYRLLDVVDAFVCNGWWKGFVRKVHTFESTKLHSVVFLENPPDSKKQIFTSEDLRPHLLWTDDVKWVRQPKLKEVPNIAHLGEQPSVEAFSNNANISRISPNQDGVKLKIRGYKSSKKRPRGLNAHVTDQLVIAADETNDDTNEGDDDLPFEKSSNVWKQLDSLEIFRKFPQKPHFSPLKDCNVCTREGAAIGHMFTFASLVEKVSKLQLEDPISRFENYLEALDILEMIVFDVKVVVDRVNELLSFKTEQEQLHSQSEQLYREIVESDTKETKLEEELKVIENNMRELEEQRALLVSQKAEEDDRRNSLRCSTSTIEDDLLHLKEKFIAKAGAPW